MCATPERLSATGKVLAGIVNEKIQSIMKRLSGLEECLQQNKARHESSPTLLNHAGTESDPQTPTTPGETHGKSLHASGDTEEPKRTMEIATPNVSAYASSLDHSRLREDEARSCIHREMMDTSDLSLAQHMVLQSALSLIEQLSRKTPRSARKFHDTDILRPRHASDVELSRGDLVHILKGGADKHVRIMATLGFPGLLRWSTIRRMAMAALTGTTSEDQFFINKVMLHFQLAVIYHADLADERDVSVMKIIEELKVRHLKSALSALNLIGFSTPPSLSLLQALVTSVIVNGILGDVQALANLTISACRTLSSLGYHLSTATPTTEIDSEIRLIVVWTYHFDAAVSMLMNRPPSLPKLQFPILMLLPHSTQSSDIIFRLFTRIARVQERAIELRYSHTQGNVDRLAQGIEALRDELNHVYSSIEDVSRFPTNEHNIDMILHVHTLEFTCYSVEATILRFSPSLTYDDKLRERCLFCARKALLSLRAIQIINLGERNAVGSYQFYISWLTSTFPLCPFFVTFCNFVRTANKDDFDLLQDVTTGFADLSPPSQQIHRLHALCVSLVDLCRPLIFREPREAESPINASSSHTSHHTFGTGPGNTTHTNNSDWHINEASEQVGRNDRSIPVYNDTINQEHPSKGPRADKLDFDVLSWNDDLLWQLFSTQPSVDWYDVGNDGM
ncbi:hypothetical protein PEBR_14390 [Penicillium brasilianum]|uniref:Transcription factor domain-containing protein n=1 Tax=Penicillium brasilianum TaxID=104259 RepID=A0A1S9RRU6_PENBI|nr:hypothetical protein PEBR_14390 [Penicillium brasilianum]